MKLYLVQHGEARPVDMDPSRGLTPKGAEDAARVGQFLKKASIEVNEIFHSGKTRAKETASILAAYIRVAHGVFATDCLSPNDDPYLWVERLQGLRENTMLVGHLPHLALLASILLCGEARSPMVVFQNAGVVCLGRTRDRGWSLQWMVVPEIIR
jgi:phosphohistidine phosphatase